MNQLLEKAFVAAAKLPQDSQTRLAQLILQEIASQQSTTLKKPRMLRPVTKGSNYTDTSINHDAALAESLYDHKISHSQA
jgi:hypothetical protein